MLPPWIDKTQFGIAVLEEIANAPQPPIFDVWIGSDSAPPWPGV